MKSETDIKRLAQFLFDNAGIIEKELCKSSHYRALNISLDMFKNSNEPSKLQITLSLYDTKTTHYYLRDNDICIERFKQICETANRDSGVIPPPKPVKVRKTLVGQNEN